MTTPNDSPSAPLSSEQELLISQAAVLHYAGNLPKKAVAEKLGVSPSKVTNLIEKAKQLGIVDYQFTMPAHHLASGKLVARFPSRIKKPQAIVVPNSGVSSGSDAYLTVSLGANHYLEQVGFDSCTITIDGGKTIAEVVEALRPRRFKDVKIYSVAGGLPHSPDTNPDALVSRIVGKYGRRSGLKPHFFPSFEGYRGNPSPRLKSEGERLIREASGADFFMLGVGVAHESSTLWRIVQDMGDNPESIIESGIAGVFGYTAIDEDGKEVPWPLGNNLFKVPPDVFKEAASSKERRVILVANGHAKVKAIAALLRGGWFNSLITDMSTAEAVLAE